MAKAKKKPKKARKLKVKKTKSKKIKAKARPKKIRKTKTAVKIKRLPYQKNLEEMEKKIAICFKKLSKDMLKDAPIDILRKECKELLLLLGEINYLAKECRMMKKKSK